MVETVKDDEFNIFCSYSGKYVTSSLLKELFEKYYNYMIESNNVVDYERSEFDEMMKNKSIPEDLISTLVFFDEIHEGLLQTD